MSWPNFDKGLLDIDWSSKKQLTIDPYLLWADATQFRGLHPAFLRADRKVLKEHRFVQARVPVAMELSSAESLKALQKLVTTRPGSKIAWEPVVISPRYATVEVPLSFLPFFFSKQVQVHVPRIELGLPTRSPKDSAAYRQQLEQIPGASGSSVRKGTYAAVIDDGCAFANRSFLRARTDAAPTSRIRRLWFQEDKLPMDGGGIGYSRRNLNQFLREAYRGGRLDERLAYAELEANLRRRGHGDAADQWQEQMRQAATHGTHVLDVMAGAPNPLSLPRYRYGQERDRCSVSPLVFVQLPRAAVADTSGGSMNCHVLDALAYIRRVTWPHHAVVNLSYGALAGPHDGSTLLEEAIDEFLAHTPQIRALTLPAGNGYDSRTHALLVATNDMRWQEFKFRLLPCDPTDTFIEAWYEPKDDGGSSTAVLDFEVIAPGGERSGIVALDKFISWTPVGEIPIAAMFHVRHPTAGRRRKHMLLLALAPTRSPDDERGNAAHGVWTLRVRNRGGHSVPVDAWIERDDSPFGAGRSRSQATFLSEGSPPAQGVPHAATFPIDRRRCLNSFAHGIWPKVAGGYGLRTQEVARYSASGPGRQGQWPGPDVCAPCEEFPGIGLLAAGTRSAHPVYMNGTSVASAALARQCVNAAIEDDFLPPPSREALDPREDHPSEIPYPDPALRRGRGLLEPMPP